MLPSLLCGFVLGKLSFAFQLSKPATGPLVSISTYLVMYRSVKRKRKSLFENRVPEAMILIPPGVDVQNDRYFEPSSLNQPE